MLIKRKSIKKILVLVFLGAFVLTTSATDKKIDLELKKVDLHDALRTLAEAEGANIFIDSALEGKVTIHLRQVTVSEAYEILAEEFNFLMQKDGNVYRILPDPTRLLRIDFDEGLLNVEIDGAPLNQVLRKLAAATQKNIVYPPEAVEKVVISIYRTDLPTALSILADHTGYQLKVTEEAFWYEKRPVAPAGLMVSWKEDLLSVDVKNVSVQEVAREITRITPISVVADSGLHAMITVYFNDLILEAGLRILCASANLSLRREEPNLYRISGGNGEFSLIYDEGLLSVEAKAVDITRILEETSRQTGLNILYGQEVRGPVSIQFHDLPLMTGLRNLLEANSFFLEERDDHLYIHKTQTHPNIKIYRDERGLFSLDIINAPLEEALSQLAKKAGENIVIFSHVTQSVKNVNLKGVTLEEAFTYLLKGTLFTFVKTDKTYIFGDGINLRPDTGDLLETHYYQLQYTSVEYLMANLPSSFPRANLVGFKEQNALLVYGSPKVQELFQEYLEEADRPENRVKTAVLSLNHLKAEEALKLLPARIPKTDLMVIREANAIAVTGTETQIDQVRQYMEEIDIQNPQLLFDILVVQLSERMAENFGLTEAGEASAGDQTVLSWQGDTLKAFITGAVFPGSSMARIIKVRLEAMVREGKASLHANPQIITLNGHPASFNVTSRYPRTVAITNKVPVSDGSTETKTETKLIEVVTGIQVSLTPWVSATRDITLEIKPKITESVPDTLVGGETNPIPATSERAIESTVRVRDGDPIVIGGLIQTQESVTMNKVPLLGDIPLLGALFRYKSVSKEETEFVIVITPHLISGEDTDPGEEKMTSTAVGVTNDPEK